MRKVILFIATSLDGYIASENGNIDWLYGHDKQSNDMGTYEQFIKNVDTVILGYNTYSQIVTELSPDVWAYAGMQSYVLTHRENLQPASSEIEFCNKSAAELVRELKAKNGKDIFICGGAKVANDLHRENLIDIYDISIIPTILGGGIRLFESGIPAQRLKLTQSSTANGIQQLTYEKA